MGTCYAQRADQPTGCRVGATAGDDEDDEEIGEDVGDESEQDEGDDLNDCNPFHDDDEDDIDQINNIGGDEPEEEDDDTNAQTVDLPTVEYKFKFSIARIKELIKRVVSTSGAVPIVSKMTPHYSIDRKNIPLFDHEEMKIMLQKTGTDRSSAIIHRQTISRVRD